MKLTTLKCALVLCSVIGLFESVKTSASADYPGVIELVGFSNRRARNHYVSPEESEQQSKTKMAADIETVKQNIEKYNKLLKVDTKNLPESQKEILQRIVERVARLKESLDISRDNATTSNEAMTVMPESQETTLADSQSTSAEMAYSSISSSSSLEDTTKNPDTMTTVDALPQTLSTAEEEDYSITNQDVNTDDDVAAAKEIPNDEASTEGAVLDEDGEIPTSTINGSGEIDDDQFVAARSNNNNHRTLVSTSNSNGKTKSRPNSTKRPGSSSTKSSSSTSSIKRVNGQKPSSMVGSSMKTTTSYTAGSITTVQPMVKIQKPLVQMKEPSSETMMKVQHQLPQKQIQQSNKLQSYQQEQDAASTLAAIQQQQQIEKQTVSPPIQQQQQSVQIQQRTPTLASSIIGGAGSTNTAGSSLGSDMLYDSTVNTSSIIDSLNNAREEFYNKGGININDKKPSATAKPTKYHYYPHNQHIYLLPECAIQQVCNAVYVRLNYTQPLCACPSRYRDPCSASLNEDDQHTTKLVGDGKKKAITLAKTCEATTEMRECRSPKDWSLLALQNTRTGKSHYLVICRCPDHFKMEGPMAHDQPTYASVPGIRVFGMMCVKPGYSVRKPSAQPPKRYQLQKPYYIPSSQNKYSSIKDFNRPSYSSSSSSLSSSSMGGGSSSLNYQPHNHHNSHQQDTFQNQHQANYQYLNRPDSGSSHFVSSSNTHGHNSHNNHNDYPESLSFSGGGIYGRNNERKGEKPIPAAEEDSTSSTSASSSSSSSTSSSSSSSSIPSSSSSSPIFSATKPEEISRTTDEIDAAPTTLEATSKRDRRSVREIDSDSEDESTPEFPWQRAIAFQRSIVWDE